MSPNVAKVPLVRTADVDIKNMRSFNQIAWAQILTPTISQKTLSKFKSYLL